MRSTFCSRRYCYATVVLVTGTDDGCRTDWPDTGAVRIRRIAGWRNLPRPNKVIQVKYIVQLIAKLAVCARVYRPLSFHMRMNNASSCRVVIHRPNCSIATMRLMRDTFSGILSECNGFPASYGQLTGLF